MPASADDSRLARKLGLADAIVIGLSAMIGAGIFAALAPAAAAAGSGLLLGLALAAVVAYANATSSAQLAAVYPEAGGTYVYGGRVLGPFWGYLAGWGFVVGKTASLAAMAFTVGVYGFPTQARAVAVASVVLVTAVNYVGVEKTARAARAVIGIVLATLIVVIVASLTGSGADPSNLSGLTDRGIFGILQSAGLLFFAFAGYARIATLGEEVVDPARTIPKAIPVALGLTLALYAAVAVAALVAIGPEALATSTAPLASAAEGVGAWSGPVVRVGGTVAALGVLLSLLAGVTRTVLAMSRNAELPRPLSAVHPVHRTPHRAEVAVAVAVIVLVLAGDLRGVIGFSSFAVLTYYGIANASALRQPDSERRWPRWIQVVGLVGCFALAFSLPIASVIGGVIVLGLGAVVWALRRPSV